MAKKVKTIPATLDIMTAVPLGEPVKRRTACYARVSTDHEDQANSYEAQVDYYTNYIKSRSDLEFVSVYADEGISGTSTAHRKGFNKMVEDALAGKIDLILTKSVSRFARNTVDSLTTIRKLKEVGCEVFFEKENIWTFDSRGELLISIMSSLSQEESRSISLNTTWGQRKRMADGKVSVPFGRFMGYDRGEDGSLVINEEQAVVIRKIYAYFLQGMTTNMIAKKLTQEGIKTPGGKEKWYKTTVKSILTNEKYRGDALLQKTFTTDYLTKKKKVNEGEVPQYYVENDHNAIIDPAVFDRVQREMQNRIDRKGSVHIFSGRIICGECGGCYGSKVWHSNDKYRRVIWQCNHKFDGEQKCYTPHLTEDQIQNAFLIAANKAIKGRDEAIAAFEAAKDTVFDTTALEKDAEETESEMQVIADRVQALIRENAAIAIDQEDYRRRFSEMSERYDEAKNRYENLKAAISEKNTRLATIDDYMKLLKKQGDKIPEFSAELWCGMVESVTVYKDKTIFTFRGGRKESVTLP